jgi:carboxypeptidase D
MDGLFLENGPLRFEQTESDGNFKLVAAQHSWHKTPAYMLYIDQPVGTGLSFTTSRTYPRNDKEVNDDFYFFLQSFLNLHADKFVEDKRLRRGFYFSGESHAGHYIPSMIAYILDQNQNAAENDKIYCPVSGAAIGNGWVDPFHQYAAAEAAYGHGIIGRAQWAALKVQEQTCQNNLNQKQYTSSICFDLLDEIVSQSYGTTSDFKVSQYDVSKVESRRGARTFPPGHKTVETYLGGTGTAAGMNIATMHEALEALHATSSREAGQVYQECTNPPYDALAHQDGLGVVNEVVQILEHDVEGEQVRLLFFNGVNDLICNHVGNEILLEKLPWKHNHEYVVAERSAWKSKTQAGDKISGYVKEFENLLYLKLLDSGHMVPMDVPDVALDMMRLFVYGGSNAFKYSPQNLNRAVDTAECPACPTCDTSISNFEVDTSEGEESESIGISSVGVGVALLGATLLGALFMARRSRQKRNTASTSYDLEMRGGTYFDDPPDTDINEGDANGSPGGKLS